MFEIKMSSDFYFQSINLHSQKLITLLYNENEYERIQCINFYNNYQLKLQKVSMYMDYQTQIQNYLTEVNQELADAQSLNTSQIIPKIQALMNSGFQNMIIQTIRTCIQHYSKDRAVIKYAHLLDKLLKLPVFNQIVQNVIVQFFCDIFIFLLIQKCYNQIDELKILRKFWLKKIHPRHIQAMKDIILVEVGIDIDLYFKQDVIMSIKNHYEKNLKLTTEEMQHHLPKTLKTSNAIYQNKFSKSPETQVFTQNSNYFITQKQPAYSAISSNVISRSFSPEPLRSVVLPNEAFIKNSNPSANRNLYAVKSPNNEVFYHQQIPQELFPMKVNYKNKLKQTVNQKTSPSMDPRDPRLNREKRLPLQQNQILQPQQNIPAYYQQSISIYQQNIPVYRQNTQNYPTDRPPFYGNRYHKIQPRQLYRQKIQTFNENFKRQRLYSQQTRSPINSEILMNQMTDNSNQGYARNSEYFRNNDYPKNLDYIENLGYAHSQPQKRFHLNENEEFKRTQISQKGAGNFQKPRYLTILQQLAGDRIFKCKQCGKGFKSLVHYDKHMGQHFQQRLNARQKKMSGQKLYNIDDWTDKRSGNSLQQFDQFYITVSNLNQGNLDEQKLKQKSLQLKQLTCRLCNQAFDIKFFQDQWILNNATYCLLDGQKIPMHKTCQEALEQSSNSEECEHSL